MNLSLKERRSVLKWFDLAVECETLSDSDLSLYDKIRESVEEEDDEEVENDPLIYTPRKKASDENNYDSDEEEEIEFNIDEYADEDSY
jgi:hypothetical protein